MLKLQPWFKFADDLHLELLQAKDEGKDIETYVEKVKSIQSMDKSNPEREIQAAEMLDKIAALPVRADYNYVEPSDIESIKEERTGPGKNLKFNEVNLSGDELYNKIYGAWLGRCVGCLLGQPIEGWTRERILGLLKETGNYPIHYYISSDLDESIRKKYGIIDEVQVYSSDLANWINNVHYMPEDDDTNYTVIGLKILEKYGPAFTSDDVAESWLTNLPVLHVCTAERIAYKNLINSIYPPQSGSYRNIYREWIGAQIRADLFGYVTPGKPELGAEMAWRDASMSHVKNGIYGEMLIAAMLSAAAVTSDIHLVIENGLSQIPARSRLYEAVRMVLSWEKEGIDWETAIERIHKLYDEKVGYHWCHTIPNAMIVCLGLLYGRKDFEKTIGIAVSAGFDTDCNGATAGSIIGMALGADVLPEKWIKPLNDQLKSGVDGFGLVKISDMAKRTAAAAEKVSEYYK